MRQYVVLTTLTSTEAWRNSTRIGKNVADAVCKLKEEPSKDIYVDVKWQDGQSVSIPPTVILAQAIDHATEHRAQIMAILTQLGIQSPALDSWTYFDVQGG